MPMPRPDSESKAFFESVLPDDPRVRARPMFGNVAGFVNGNMFMGLFGNDLFVRLCDGDRAELLEEEATSILEPMKGRPMKEYVVIPQTWWDEPDTIGSWVARSLDWVAELPEKKGHQKKRQLRSTALAVQIAIERPQRVRHPVLQQGP